MSRLVLATLVSGLLCACGRPASATPAAGTDGDTTGAEATIAEPEAVGPGGVERDVVARAVDRLLSRTTVGALALLPLAEREDEVFHLLYNTIDGVKPCAIDQAEYDRRLAARAVRAETRGPWHVRWGALGTADLEADARRIYLDVLPDAAAALADALTDALDARGVARYSLKVLSALDTFDIPVPAVLYVEAPDYAAAREITLAYAADHSANFWLEEAPFTRRLAPGVSAADEIGSAGPPGVAGQSFGGAMSHLLALALEGAAPDASADDVRRRLRAALAAAGFDPARPWLRPGHTVDDF